MTDFLFSLMFRFKRFTVSQNETTAKVGTDGVLLGAWADVSSAQKILDIGTGTGVIALILAQRSSAQIDAMDMDASSCALAEENVKNSIFAGRIKVIQKSLKQFAKEQESRYDLIISNPPFFFNSLKSPSEMKNRIRHSDFSEMSSGSLIESAKKLLNPEGKFCLILPPAEAELFISNARVKGLFCSKLTRVFSKPGKPCKRYLMQFEFQPLYTKEEILHIETEEPNQFSEKYKNLTKDFYLRF
jgi:tRNA1Val (adenine37-N6)-methyltransferase